MSGTPTEQLPAQEPTMVRVLKQRPKPDCTLPPGEFELDGVPYALPFTNYQALAKLGDRLDQLLDDGLGVIGHLPYEDRAKFAYKYQAILIAIKCAIHVTHQDGRLCHVSPSYPPPEQTETHQPS